MTNPRSFFAITAFALLAGCATATSVQVPQLPATLRPAAGEVAFLEVLAVGVQIYECAATATATATASANANAGASGGHTWQFRAPEAALTDRAGRALGKHYAGPTWEAADGSMVVGEVKARDPGPQASAIPWLLLNAKSTAGTGVFAKTKSIQRVDTVAGMAPSAVCEVSNQGQVVRVPYTATYYFYRAAS